MRPQDYIARNVASLLESTEWTQADDSGLPPERVAEYAAYRQKLQELPEKFANVTSISEIIWPSVP